MSTANQPDLPLHPIGLVHSSVTEIHHMPVNGVPAQVEIFPEFQLALASIQSNSHLIVLGWFHLADRQRLQVTGRTPTPEEPLRGVFGLRSSDRPNPIGLNVARLLSVDGLLLSFDRLDMLDGTPIVDLKRYSLGWDCVFSARTSRERRPPRGPYQALDADLTLEAEHFHGEACQATARAADMVLAVTTRWGVSPKDSRLQIEVGRDGHLADSLQAILGATLGAGRLHVRDAATVRFLFQDQEAVYAETGELLREGNRQEGRD